MNRIVLLLAALAAVVVLVATPAVCPRGGTVYECSRRNIAPQPDLPTILVRLTTIVAVSGLLLVSSRHRRGIRAILLGSAGGVVAILWVTPPICRLHGEWAQCENKVSLAPQADPKTFLVRLVVLCVTAAASVLMVQRRSGSNRGAAGKELELPAAKDSFQSGRDALGALQASLAAYKTENEMMRSEIAWLNPGARLSLEDVDYRRRPDEPVFRRRFLPSRGEACLVQLHGPCAGLSVLVGDMPVRLGREGAAIPFVYKADVSRRHAVVWRQNDGSFAISDMSSSEGTFVNDVRIVGAHVLHTNDKLSLGTGTHWRFLCDPGLEAQLHEVLFSLSGFDTDSGLCTGPHFKDLLQREMKRCKPREVPLSIAMLEVDTQETGLGRRLGELARVLESLVGVDACLGRLGKTQVVVMLSGKTIEECSSVISAFHQIITSESGPVGIEGTIILVERCEADTDAEHLLGRACRSLAAAKLTRSGQGLRSNNGSGS